MSLTEILRNEKVKKFLNWIMEEPRRFSEIRNYLNMSDEGTRKFLRKLMKAGLVEKNSLGLWQPTTLCENIIISGGFVKEVRISIGEGFYRHKTRLFEKLFKSKELLEAKKIRQKVLATILAAELDVKMFLPGKAEISEDLNKDLELKRKVFDLYNYIIGKYGLFGTGFSLTISHIPKDKHRLGLRYLREKGYIAFLTQLGIVFMDHKAETWKTILQPIFQESHCPYFNQPPLLEECLRKKCRFIKIGKPLIRNGKIVELKKLTPCFYANVLGGYEELALSFVFV